ncbi:PfaD family polyunsaturated fatty acid/polyketide biosynthesis protein [Tahibacter amnicola]|uniref:PfaD family polyunsaturated fatty acid/polyketide biosynthesis protein n=1 Tax=Tahibacter amnicola TaxID=2976241 RepID=A0ABY6BBE2_9GAMM|nr:PfaD family polyunsaturated fatty acid/polyketide biosynthesis protein [Tahibacter amnicola]UXI65951.1 PfaD family polyunsaturated fatty acid/polyketide biosynthesis protein [Tahibacter amnicola]
MPVLASVPTIAPHAPAHWRGAAPAFAPADLAGACAQVRHTAVVVRDDRDGRLGVGIDGTLVAAGDSNCWPVLGLLPPLYPEWLGDRTFSETHGTRFPYVAGAMANGIATTRLVTEMARAGCLGFFGAAGLSLARVEAAVDELARELDPRGMPWGVNLIHSPGEPAVEDAVADLLIRRGVRCVEASAFMGLTPAIVRYAASGLTVDGSGTIQRRHRVLAKISREEVAKHFMAPMPVAILDELVARNALTRAEADLAARVPLAEDITCEADSGGHTDNRPLAVLLPTILTLRDRIVAGQRYARPIRVGAAGGLGTPGALASAFALGAAYVQTGSVNQACVESGLGAGARAMLAQASMADVIMAPAADMFEMGVDVQVLRRGTLFAIRARKLYEIYRAYPSLEAVPAAERAKIEKEMLRASFEEAWASTRAFWSSRDPSQVTRAESDPKHRMALVFRSYLGLSSRWAIDGVTERLTDYQIWCGPAMGAFNTWVAGSFLEAPARRTAVQVALNLLEGAAVLTRAQQLRTFGLPIPSSAFDFRPRPLA